jgi:cytochrome P450
MKQHEWAWKETLRLMPISGFLPRRALREVTVAGHRLAAGTLVTPMNGGIGRHPKWWTNPTSFDPERFSPERAEDRKHAGIYNPFGAGAHACIGMQLANMEMKLFWHRLFTMCRFRLTKDHAARHTFTPVGIVSGDVALTLERIDDTRAGSYAG